MSDDPTTLAPQPDEPPPGAPPPAEPLPPGTRGLDPPSGRSRSFSRVRRFAFLAIPLLAVSELGAHLLQINTVVTDKEWLAAREAVRGMVKPSDLVVMAPYWTDPIGRELFKDDILSIAREARPDSTRFPRAIEVSTRGQHLAELASWSVESSKKVGPVTLTVRDNPSYAPVEDDLVDHVAPGKMDVSVLGGTGTTDCAFTHAHVETGGLGFGPALAADRFVCPQGGMVVATVMQPADYRPHRCLFSPPLGSGKTLRVRFENVKLGNVLHGHAGIDWDSTAHEGEPPVTLVWKIGDRTVGRITAGNEDGWKSFELDTRELKGTTGDVVAEVSCPSSRNRLYCFEADTR